MRVVERAVTAPSRCAVLPFVGMNDGPFIDTGSELPGKGDRFDCHVYVSFKGLRALCQEAGWPTPEEHQQALELLEQATAMAEAAVAERDELKERFEAIDVLGSAGFRARKKPGRKKSEEVAA